ncbi:hypothetical protein R5R35_008115 [Gryllus longicercus]|uniref:Uncharacterized protein n=1 Tax=Gryllus longicercus TaxID=2509291 RepID=A0AAN9UZB5_9ORTH
MITGMDLLSFMSNKPWALKFLTQQQHKVLIRITGLVLLFIGILYAVQIMQFEARKRHVSSSHDSANNAERKYITGTDNDWLSTTFSNFSTNALTNNNDSYTTDKSWSPPPGGEVSAVMTTKQNSSYTPVSWIPIAENDVEAAKSNKACNNSREETDSNISPSLSEDGNYTSQKGWLHNPVADASSVERHSNNTVVSYLPASDISTPKAADSSSNYSSEAGVLASPDSKSLDSISAKPSNNDSATEANQFPSVVGKMFPAVSPKNYSDLSQIN